MILGPDGSPEAPTEVLAKLKKIDEALGLRYVQGVHAQYWALTWKWPENDPRRAMIQRGDMRPDADFDVFAEIPLDCQVEQIPGWCEKGLRRFSGTKQEVDYLLSRLDKYNEAVKQAPLDKIRELGDELFKTNAATLFTEQGKTAPKFYVNNPQSKRIKKPKPIRIEELPEDL